ncbi:TIGR03943 family putative permease subunit [Clostridium formicaceticum]|uniref:TIGR03943 family protein n=1 Tax=Clostridium formicaceticum TaxID=1497 RepID=A0AAC9RRF1_9CLOT|nr:TIGR03943 family protein [Clostridium formicaceticum]AOY75034.1 TIGR03943 family protein [Clostridium formicaceticum]ARE89453.1 hypothetical protein CLFO_39310 [Clostridium formicaceticum]
MKNIKINFRGFCEFLILLGFTGAVYYLFNTGKIARYVPSKWIKYGIFYLFILTMVTIAQIKKVFIEEEKVRFGYSIILIPVLLIFTIGNQNLDGDFSQKKDIDIGYREVYEQDNEKETITHHLLPQGKISIDPSKYIETLTEIFYYLDQYHGREIELEGFVHSKGTYGEYQFIVARKVVSCCIDDAETLGLLCYWDKEETLKEDTWVKIKGVLQSTNYYDETVDRNLTFPIVIIEELIETEVPDDPYIYN